MNPDTVGRAALPSRGPASSRVMARPLFLSQRGAAGVHTTGVCRVWGLEERFHAWASVYSVTGWVSMERGWTPGR